MTSNVEQADVALQEAVCTRTWTKGEYRRLVELEFFGEDERVELIEGHIVTIEPPDERHRIGIVNLTMLLVPHYQRTHVVLVQCDVIVSLLTCPKPDVSVFKRRTPGVLADLVVEVSHTSLRHDRDYKANVYAQAGVQVYWILNVVDQQVEVYMKPEAKRGAFAGHVYRNVVIYKMGDQGPLPALEGVTVAVADMFEPL